MGWGLSPSRKFLVFLVVFLGGLAVGSRVELPINTLLWLGGLWLLIFISGQEERIELTSLIATAFLAGLTLWQVTGGEAWLSSAPLAGVIAKIEQFRAVIIDRIFLALPEPHGSLLTGILLGNRVKLDKELLETFRIVGLSHLIAVSGYNLSILTANAQILLRPWLGQRAAIVSFFLIVAFIIISGAPASILRAGVMASALLLATYLGRPSRSINILILAAGVLAAFEPKILFEIGFQLSLAATYGLVRLAPIIIQALERFPKIPETLRLIIGETLAATLLTAPILVAYFERISLVSPLSNLLVLPIMPLLMGLGIAGTVLLLVLPSLGSLFILLNWPLLEWIVRVSNWLTEIPHAATPASLPGWVTAAMVIGLIIAVEWLNHRWRHHVPDPVITLKPIRV